jgi:hypothetical protein
LHFDFQVKIPKFVMHIKSIKISMKKTTLVFTGLCFSFMLQAQKEQNPKVITYPNGVTYSTCAGFEISRPLKELAAENPAPHIDMIDKKEVDNKEGMTRRIPHVTANPNAKPLGVDPNIQSIHGTRAMTSPLINFTGQTGSGYPNDPTGAAGLTAYVQAVNTTYCAFNKTTTVPLMSAMSLNSLWPGSSNDGDPIVLYDKYADRWFIQQFQQSGNKILIAISTTNDPTGTFYKYTFIPSSSDFPDYPKFSIWPDGYYMTSNYNTQRVVVFNRTQMLAGNPSAGMIVKTLPSVPNNGFFCPLPADADGSLPPSGTPMYIFSFEDDNWGPYTDQIHIFKMTTNWTTPSSTTLVEDTPDGSPLPTVAFDSYWSNYGTEISQKGTTQGLDAIQGVFMYRAPFRVWTGYNSILLCNAVNVNTTTGQSGIRWYELRQNTSSGAWTIYQQGTYSPDSENRWMASMAMDDNGSIGMAFAVSGAGEYPSLRYTGRLATDPLGQMSYTEQTAVAGTASEIGINRYGDYGHTSLDPDGVTFWHTGEWQSSANGNESRIFSWQLPLVTGIATENHILQPAYSAYQINNSLLVKASNLTVNEEVHVDLFDIEGRQINGKIITPVSNAFETNVDVTGLSKGVYLVRIGNLNFQKVIKVSLN